MSSANTWHDLKKDIGDLPEWDDFSDKRVVSTHGIYYTAFYDARLRRWFGGGSDNLPVRAWRDIPEDKT